ncbi:hypothetical protein [Paenimyroides aestuarii]|uniref:Uncharacterized protein n=1 Tax=Paenimyroides aestuarii TaxID=2968490 RepID=A0ABY5NUA8_9FLAO|nr:hypothetical protein [Paenimyroides aestuarii]UUV22177.1 hypothetical protein NPX36_03835 [Paenimyroides aestuarii]
MKLSVEQIHFIETALIVKCNFKDFDDVRMELTDHIASEIEVEIENNRLLFDTAFVKVMTRWNPMILPKSWSRYENVPYMVCKLWKSLDWKYNFSAIPFTLILTVGIMFLQRKEVEVGFLIYFIEFIGVLSCLFLNFKARKNKFKTTLSIYATDRLFTYSLLLILFISIAIGLNVYDGDTKSQPLLWVIIHTTVILSLRSILMYKNVKIENQLLKVM